MIRPEALSNPNKALPISNFHTNLGLMRNPLMAAILQSVIQQRQQEQAKAQILQATGFGANPNPMGSIPNNAGIMTMDGKAFVRPGGTPPAIQALLNTLLGLKESPYIDSFGPLQKTGVMDSSQIMKQDPNSVVATARRPSVNGQAESNEIIDPYTLELLLMQGMQNSGQWNFGESTTLPPRGTWRY